MRSIRSSTKLAVLVPVAIFGAGCGGGDTVDDQAEGTGSGGEPGVVELDVEPGSLAFVEEEVMAGAGTITLRSMNPDEVEHNIAIEGDGVSEEGELVSSGDVSEVTVELEPGEYELYCTPHRQAGMVAKLTIA